jgi:hypothetical protein
MSTEIKIVLSEKNAEQLQRAAHGAGLKADQVVLLAVLAITGVFPMTTFAQIHRTMTACKKAPAEIRDQVGMVLSAGLGGALVGVDFETALNELVDLVEEKDDQWSATA